MERLISKLPPIFAALGLAGLVVAGFGLAPVYLAPTSQYLLGHFGLQKSMLIFGVAFGNIFKGLPMDASGYHGDLLYLLNPYGLLTGLMFVQGQTESRPSRVATRYSVSNGSPLAIASA